MFRIGLLHVVTWIWDRRFIEVETETPVFTPIDGIVVGRTNLPLITEGEALYHIACFGQPDLAAELLAEYRDALDPDDDTYPVII